MFNQNVDNQAQVDWIKAKKTLKNLRYSGEIACVNVGKPKRPTYFPVELCSLVPLERYTKSLSNLQRTSLVQKSRLSPKDIVHVLEPEIFVKLMFLSLFHVYCLLS